MLVKLALIIPLLFNSCGRNAVDDFVNKQIHNQNDTSHHRPATVEPSIQPYLDHFKALYKANVSIRIEFGDVQYPTVAVCFRWSDGYRDIDVNEKAWKETGDLGKEQLIFHELGHCILNREHDDTLTTVGSYRSAKKSIMNAYVFGDTFVYRDNKDYYYTELFGIK